LDDSRRCFEIRQNKEVCTLHCYLALMAFILLCTLRCSTPTAFLIASDLYALFLDGGANRPKFQGFESERSHACMTDSRLR
jgi:hypothetical protein